MDDRDKEKTAFSIGSGLWQFTVMPFGLCNAPATFERLMEQVLSGLPLSTALVYLDDVLVPARTFADQISNLRQVFQRFRNAHLKLSPKKCSLFQKEVKYLGHIVSSKGIATDPEKVEAVQSWPTPTDSKEVRSFVGLCSYYRKFIPDFANIAHPLHQCAEKFNWTAEVEAAFNQLKQALTEAPVLGYPSLDGQFILDTDASNLAIGAVLSQVQDGVERVLAYYSRSLDQAEKNYCVTRKELLAAVKAIRHFHPYLLGRSFILRTDHAALRWLINFRSPEGQIARWLQQLQQYDYHVEHRQGAKHNNADALSRRPCARDECRHCDRLDQKEEHLREKEAGPHTCYAMQVDARDPDLDCSGRWSKQELREAQEQDKEVQQILHWREKSDSRPSWEIVAPFGEIVKSYWAQWDSLCVCEGVLYRLWENSAGNHITKQLVLPKALRATVLHQLHNSPTAGHLGINKTMGKVKERFYWVNYHSDVKKWCKTCDICSSRSGPQKKPRAPLGQYNVGVPMERIAIDVLGPLPTTDEGNKYLLIAADYFTKWVEAYPLPNQEATTVAEVLVNEFVCRFGTPQIIHSDQGRNFESAVFTEMCRLLGITKTRTTPLHPESDGMVERFNRTIESQMSKFVDANQRDWDVHVPLLLMAYRSSVHDTTGCTPAQLMLGRSLRLPIDLHLGRPEDEVSQHVSTYADELQAKMERVHEFARLHLQLRSDQMKERYDSCIRDCQLLKKGDPVWLYWPQRKKGLSPKLMRSWKGPYVVTKKINDLIYRIQLGPHAKPKVVHRNRLWLYRGPSPPTWIKDDDKEQPSDHTTPDPPRQISVSIPDDCSEGKQVQTQRRSQRHRRPPDRFAYLCAHSEHFQVGE